MREVEEGLGEGEERSRREGEERGRREVEKGVGEGEERSRSEE